MRKIAFWLSLVMIFTIPWEDVILVGGTGLLSLSKVIGYIVAGLWALTILSEGRIRKFHIFHAFVLIFILWNILSYIWSIDASYAIFRIKTYGQIFLLILIVWELYKKPEDLTAGLQAYVLGSYVCIGSSIYNYINDIGAVRYEVRFSATGVNAVDLALLLSLSIPIAWHLILQADRKQNRFIKILNILYIPLALFAILITGSRTSLFALIPAIIYIARPKRLDIGQFIIIAVFLIASLFVILTIIPQQVIARLATASTSISSQDIGGRVAIWKGALTVFSQHPVFGAGAGTNNITIGGSAHNTYLSILAETGLIGLFLFLCILALVLNQAARLFKEYAGLWFSVFFVWAIGVLSLGWEVKKVTWLILSFVIIEGAALQEHYLAEKLKEEISDSEKGQSLPSGAEFGG
jgi:O-antigen ligase